MFKVGVTGGIGSGKSVVCKVFRHLGVPVYSADREAKRLMAENESIRAALQEFFGTDVFQDGQLNRKYLAGRVFSDEKAREFVNSLVHPLVRNDFTAWAAQPHDSLYVIEEAALLFETGAWRELDYTILLVADRETRIERIIRRDGISRAAVQARMASQMDPRKSMEYADLVIHNDPADLVIPQVLRADKMIRDLALGKA
jgi:dephospho-CoA kinase